MSTSHTIDPITKWVVGKPRPAGFVLSGVAVALLIVSLIYFVGSFQSFREYDAKQTKTSQVSDTFALPEAENTTADAVKEQSQAWRKATYALAALLGGLGLAGGAFWQLRHAQATEEANRVSNTRILLMGVGSVLGLAIFLLGIVLFRGWFDILYQTLFEGKSTSGPMWQPLTALLIAVLGLGLIFLATIPARAEERNNSLVRRIVYANNLFLTLVLVVIGLALVNVVGWLKLPNRLDTSAGQKSVISPATQEYLEGLTTGVTIYVIAPEQRPRYDDVRALLGSFREANPNKISVKNVSTTLDKNELQTLSTKYPAFTKENFGVIIASQVDDKRHTFVLFENLYERKQDPDGSFKDYLIAEGKLVREILYVTESSAKPVVYFTQGAGELAIDPQPGELADALRKASQLKTALQAEGCDVRTLRLSAQDPNPKVPDDATIVVVADPTSTLNPAMVTAITNYMKKPSDKAPSGKLIVIAQAHPKPGNTPGVLEIGLESLLAEQGVVLANKLLLASSTDQNPPNQHFVRAYQPLINSRNPIALSLQRKLLVASNPRPIGFERQTGQASPWTTTALLHTYESRIPWLESYVPADMNQAEREFVAGVQAKRPEVLDKILVNPRTDELVTTATAVLVTQNVDAETKMGRVAVFSFADFFTDLDAATSPGGELLAATTNWLRDRPAIATIAPKEYGVYRPKLDMNWNSVFWFPVGLMLFCVITAGLGTWMIRRK